MSRRFALIIAVGSLVFMGAYFLGPGAVQRRAMTSADEFAERLVPVLRADSRFSAVEIRQSSAPAVILAGQVADAKALRDLKAIATAPPDAEFRVSVQVRVFESRQNRGD